MSTHDINSLAIIGMACRFPGSVTDPEQLWTLLVKARNCWTDVPWNRFNEKAFHYQGSGSNEPHLHHGGHFIAQNVAAFDTGFFNISPVEANAMDPQQRILLETTYEALEDGGLTIEDVRGSKTAVYVATFTHDYDRNLYKDPSDLPKYNLTGNGEAIVSNRISYVFDLKGPSMTLDTGCSGSLVALHLASQSIRAGEVDMAIVGGVNLILNPDHTIALNDAHMLNARGRSFPFDRRGSGYGRGEGSSVVILKRLKGAVEAGNPVRAILRNTAINQDGKTPGITFPNKVAQEELERSIYADVGLDPREVGYVEAHGTGTVAGDLAEVEAISRVFCDGRVSPLPVGSIKSNIGHLESASGLAGLIKAVLILEKGLIPANADFREAKADLRLTERRIMVPTALDQLKGSLISVNSFGYGGTNAHAILEKYIRPARHTYNHYQLPNLNKQANAAAHRTLQAEKVLPLRLFIISAKSEASLHYAITNLRGWALRKQDDSYMEDLSFTLAKHRSAFDWRFTFVAHSHEEVVSTLAQRPKLSKVFPALQVGFLFTGQGAQYHGMGRDLICMSDVFRGSIEKSGSMLRELGAEWDLVTEISLDHSEIRSQIHRGEIAQPAATALQIALVDLLNSIGIRAQAVIGHSSGEIAAAYCVGAISHATAIRVSYYRGLTPKTHGAMLAIGLGNHDVLKLISETEGKDGAISIACINSLTNTTVSGNADAVFMLKQRLDRLSIFNRMVHVDTAYHSPHMHAASSLYYQNLEGMQAREAVEMTQFISTVTAKEKTANFDAQYWAESLVSEVLYHDALKEYFRSQEEKFRSTAERPLQILIEVGPDSVLAGPTRQTVREYLGRWDCHYFSSLSKGNNAVHAILTLAGKMFEHGLPVSVDHLLTLSPSNTCYNVIQGLPTYAWDHSKEYWHEPRLSSDYRFRKRPRHELLGLRLVESSTLEPRWRSFISVDSLPWLKDHVVDSLVIFPGAAYICMAVHALCELIESRLYDRHALFTMTNVSFLRALVIPQSPHKVELQISMNAPLMDNAECRNSWREFRVSSRSSDGDWKLHCCGSIKAEPIVAQCHDDLDLDWDSQATKKVALGVLDGCNFEVIDRSDFYDNLEANGNFYGPQFAAISRLEVRDKGQAIAHVAIPLNPLIIPANNQLNVIHPTTLDALMHACFPLYRYQNGPGSVMPVSIDELTLSSEFESRAGEQVSASVTLASKGPRVATAAMKSFNDDQPGTARPTLTIVGMELRGLGETIEKCCLPLDNANNISYQMEWGPHPDSIRLSITDIFQPAGFETSQLMKLEILNNAASIYIYRAIDKFPEDHLNTVKNRHMKFFSWMRKRAASLMNLKGNDVTAETTGFSVERTISELHHQGVEGEMLSRIGQNLPGILSGNVDPLQVMMEGDLLHKYYQSDSSARCYGHLRAYVKKRIFHNPHMIMLEIGAGTAGATIEMFKTLAADRQVQLERYDFTDVSAGFFERAKRLLVEWVEFIEFKTLNIELAATDQGYAKHSYDLVLAANVLHATTSIDRTLQNARSLLKSNGTLILIEATQPQAYLNIIFGTLPGWWQGVNDGREDSPLLTQEQWHRALCRSGFSGIDTAVDDTSGPGQIATMMISKACDTDSGAVLPPIVILAADNDSQSTGALHVQALLKAFEQRGFQVTFASWDCKLNQQDTVFVVVDNGAQPLLVNPTTSMFRKIIELATETAKVLWISMSEDPTAIMNPEKNLVTGFARTAHAENENLEFVTFDVQQISNSQSGKLVKTIINVLLRTFCSPESSSKEREFIYRNHQLQIPRLIPNTTLDHWVSQASGRPETEMRTFGEAEHSLRLRIEDYHPGKRLAFIHDERSKEQLKPFSVEIDVKAFGLNQRDAMLLSRQPKSWMAMGEYAGVVTGLGSSSTKLSIGDRVCAINGRPFASRVHINGENVIQLPQQMSFTTAASIPLVFLTAHHTLFRIAGLRKGQTILIHYALKEYGEAAIILAQSIGAKILVIVSHRSDRGPLIQRFGIPTECILFERWTSLKPLLLNKTDGTGVDIMMTLSPEEMPVGTLSCLAPYGTLIQLRISPVSSKTRVSLASFADNVTSVSFDPVSFVRDRPRQAMESLAEVMSMFRNGEIGPKQTIKVFSIAAIDDAFQRIQNQDNIGKVVVDAGNNDSMVRTINVTHPLIKLDGSGTYIIAGGLGDFGQRMIRIMAARGARNIIALSRRSLLSKELRDLPSELQSVGIDCRFHFERCNIADASQVRRAADVIRRMAFPPVKGVVQSASVLRDVPLWKMELEDFQAPLDTKLRGTQNLSDAFGSSPLDFFLNLSSTSSVIGSRGSANYGAGNCFQDAFAQTHGPSKTRYVSANIGGMVEGAAVNNRAQERNLREQGLLTITSDQLLGFLEFAMSSDCCKQPVIGFNRLSLSRAKLLNATPRTAMFTHVWSAAKTKAPENNNLIEETLKLSISKAKGPDEIHQIMITAVAKKISDLVAVNQEVVDPSSSMAELGLDSLITIELKNWIARELAVAIQASEILDQKSVHALVRVLMSRSHDLGSLQGLGRIEATERGHSENIRALKSSTRLFLTSHEREPYLPLPDLGDTLQMYLTMCQCFLSSEQFTHTKQAIRDFQREGGIGQKLQNRLEARKNNLDIENWQWDPYARNIYLARRDPIHPFMTFYGGHPSPSFGHDQADRAAIISLAAFKFMQHIESGTLKQNTLNGESVCMDTLQWLFNACRKPALKVDEMQKSPGNNYLVALRRGHQFRIHLEKNGQLLSHARLKAIFRFVLGCTEEKLPAVATLTAGERNIWAELRGQVLSVSKTNTETLSTIEAAAFVVCLDDGNPSNPSDRCNQFFLGDPSNRWSDKTLQFVVCENGASAFIGEHAMLDGLSVTQMNRFIAAAILAHEKEEQGACMPGSEPQVGHTNKIASELLSIDDWDGHRVKELTFTTNETLERYIDQIREEFYNNHVPIEFTHFTIPTLGHSILRKHKCSSKAGYQLVIQLACLLYYGYNPPSWETISMARFHKGRVDWVQTVQPAIAAFCAAARENTIPLAEQRAKFFEAMSTHVNTMTRIAQGHGFKAHMHCLLEMLGEDEEIPELFKDRAWEDTRVQSTKIVKTDCLEGLMVQEMAFLMPQPDCIFLHYEIKENECQFFVQAWPGKTKEVCDALMEAATRVRTILESGR